MLLLGLKVHLVVVVEKVRHGDHLYALVKIIDFEKEYLLRGPEGTGSEGALSLP